MIERELVENTEWKFWRSTGEIISSHVRFLADGTMTARGAVETCWSMQDGNLLLETQAGEITTRFDRLQMTAGNNLRLCGTFVAGGHRRVSHFLDTVSSLAPFTERRMNIRMSLTGETDTLLIIFNSAGSPAIGDQNRWEFAKLPSSLGVDYVRISESQTPTQYYLDKIDWLRRTLVGVVSGHYRTVVLVGMSSGGYASLLFAELLAHDLPSVAFKTLVINPQTGHNTACRSFIRDNVPAGVGPEVLDSRAIDLSVVSDTDLPSFVAARTGSGTEISHTIYYDSLNAAEIYYTGLVKDLPGFRTQPVPLGLPHVDSSIAIYRLGLLQSELRSLLGQASPSPRTDHDVYEVENSFHQKKTETKDLARETETRRKYEVVSLEWLVESKLASRDGSPLVEKTRLLPDASVPIPPIVFGEIVRPTGHVPEWPADGWGKAAYDTGDLFVFSIRDALVHGEQGVVTVGPYLIQETTYHTNMGLIGFEQVDKTTFTKTERGPDVSIKQAAHACCGYVGNRNYAHWLVDVMPAILVPPFGTAFADRTLVLPAIRSRFQTQMLDLVPELEGRAVFVGQNSVVACGDLRIVPGILHSDPAPHPSRRVMLDELRRRAVGSEKRSPERLYVSRKDAGARTMRNEDAVIEVLRANGFRIAILSEMSVQEQIAAFATATHVVGAHGAGLANVLFCRPETTLIEFHMSSSIIWTIRRLAAVAGLRYGCIFGKADDDSLPVDARTWTLPVRRLKDILKNPAFS